MHKPFTQRLMIPILVGVPLLLVVVFGVVIKVAVGPSKPPPNNVGCPHCLTAFRIEGLENYSYQQKAAIKRRCPTCNHYDDILIFEMIWNAAGKRPVPEEGKMNWKSQDKPIDADPVSLP